MFDKLIHHWLDIPYSLHVTEFQKPKHSRVTVLLLHGLGASSKMWTEIAEQLPNNTRIIAIDLLGFGDSPSPQEITYDARTHTRAIAATLFKMRILDPIVVVGHSLGGLIAIEYVKRYPDLVKSLILISPPLYRKQQKRQLSFQAEARLRNLYKLLISQPKNLLYILTFATEKKIFNQGFHVDEGSLPFFIASLESSIINQTSMRDLRRLSVPIHIITGRFDPVVIGSNITRLEKSNPNISHTSVIGVHEIHGFFVPAVIKAITNAIDQ